MGEGIDQMLPGTATLVVITAWADSIRNVVFPGMNNSKIQLRAFARDIGGELGLAQDQLCALGLMNGLLLSIHGVAVHLGVIIIGLEQRTDSVVASQAGQI